MVLAALFFSLAVYAYLAARLLLAVIPIIFLTLYWLIATISGRAQPTQLRHLFLLISKFYLLNLVFLAPLIAYFIINPADFVARVGTVSIFNPEWNQGDLLGTVWRTFTLTLGTFLGLSGDPNPLVNLPGRPALPPAAALFFVVGLTMSLLRVIKLTKDGPAHLLLLCWWGIMLLPALLAPEGAPHHLRLIGSLIPTYLFIAIGLTTLCQAVARLTRQPTNQQTSRPANQQPHPPAPTPQYPLLATCVLLPALLYLFLAFQTYTHYFIRWPHTDFILTFDLYATQLAEQIAQADVATTTVLPMDIRAGNEARHYTLDFLLAPGEVDYSYLPVDERNAERVLSQAVTNKETLRVVRWTADKHLAADEKEIVAFLLQTQATLQNIESFPAYNIETYALNPHANYSLPAINQPIGADFDGLLRLDAAHVPNVATPGQSLPVALTLAPLAPMDTDYRASLRLIGPGGERVAQVDRTLRHNFHQDTSLWPPESVNEYYLLPLPSDAAPGNYTVTVVLYHPDTQAPLVAAGMAEVPIGVVLVE